jgi:hypothetical protein
MPATRTVADPVQPHRLIQVNMKEISRHRRGNLPVARVSKHRLKRRCAPHSNWRGYASIACKAISFSRLGSRSPLSAAAKMRLASRDFN